MLIIVDRRIPKEAREKLSGYGELMELHTDGITYPAISGHPDIFFCQGPGHLVVAPNLPKSFDEILIRDSIPVVRGELPVGGKYPETARYNAVVTDNYIIHNFRHSDSILIRTFKSQIPLQVDQGYCRCNLLALKDDHFITSDQGMCKALKRHAKNVLNVTTKGILLEGFQHGFFGGCCGVCDDRIFIAGSLKHYEDGEEVKVFLNDLGYEIVELYDGPLVDGGGVLFISVKF